MPISDAVDVDLPGIVLRLAGQVGQATLSRSAGQAGTRAAVDQHASELREALACSGRAITPRVLVGYAQGFTEAAIARGWRPPQRGAGRQADGDVSPDWESLRLAAVCQLFIEAQGLSLAAEGNRGGKHGTHAHLAGHWPSGRGLPHSPGS